jgi:hypothetical protein
MSQKTLQKFSDVIVINGSKTALEIALRLKESPINVQRAAFGGDWEAGFIYLHRIDKFPDTVYECIASSEEGDSITSIYKNHSIFGSLGDLMKARTELINAIVEKVGMSVTSIGIDDESRGRALDLRELSTGQLIDTLAERMGQSVLVTNSYSAV